MNSFQNLSLILNLSLSLPDLLSLSFCTFAVAYYVTREDGPLAIFYRLRMAVGAGVEADDVAVLGDEALHTEPAQPMKRGGLAQLLSCPYCLSPYAAAFSLLLWVVAPVLVYLLATAGVSVCLLNAGDR